MRLEAVSKSYMHRGRAVAALDNASLEIATGDFVAVVGPSGSGKSTLLLVLGGMLSPSMGKVFLNGRSLYELSPNQRAELRRQKVGFVFQTFNLVPYLTALENVQIPLFLAGLDGAVQKQRAAALLERVGLGDRLDHKPAELSIGQQQRVAMARVLANDPQIILADEPTGNLDSATGEDIMAAFERIWEQGNTVILVTHEADIAAHARRVVRMRDGHIESDVPSPGRTAATPASRA